MKTIVLSEIKKPKQLMAASQQFCEIYLKLESTLLLTKLKLAW